MLLNVPIGGISPWVGTVDTLPPQWILCDGNNGTPDFRDKFVVGAGDTYNPDNSGGSAAHAHTIDATSHYHLVNAGATLGTAAPNLDDFWASETITGSAESADNRPPYYSVFYLMRIK